MNKQVREAIQRSIEQNIRIAREQDKIDAERERKEAKRKSVKNLERDLKRQYLSSVEINNDLNVAANVYADTDDWQYKVNITYKLNKKEHLLQASVGIGEVQDPVDLNRFIRSHVLDSLAKVITNEAFRQNQRVFKGVSKEYMG
tara:strand:- start:126 stop:557 length:432 start_codon:yes stop_codon:yes gene_type:complete